MEELYQNKYRIRTSRATWWSYQDGAYFITICTKDKRPFFGNIADDKMSFSFIGNIANQAINEIESHFDKRVNVPYYVVMPNHIHLLLFIQANDKKQVLLKTVIATFKAAVTRKAKMIKNDFALQPRYHDHIVRNNDEMKRIIDYIQNNVFKWSEDKYYE